MFPCSRLPPNLCGMLLKGRSKFDLLKAGRIAITCTNRRFSSDDNKHDELPKDVRIPKRVLKRLEKMNATDTRYELVLGDESLPTKDKNKEFEKLFHDSQVGNVDKPEFPSDIKSHNDMKRLQSRKAFRPKRDPSQTSLVLFPGQGSQFVGMGNKLLPYPGVKELYDKASNILGYDLLKLCLDGPKRELDKTVHCQPAVMVTSLAAVIKMRELYPQVEDNCVGTAGFSVGELAALVFAEALSFEDGIKLVKVRAEGMQEASEDIASGMMTAFCGHDTKLNFALHSAVKYCQVKLGMHNPTCRIANFLYPECKVIGGNMEALKFLEENGRDFGIRRLKSLPVSGAFHTELMQPAKERFIAKLRRTEINKPIFPVYSNVTASRYRSTKDITKMLTQQIFKPVKWEQIMHTLYSREQGEAFPITFELGPGNQLGVMLKKVNAKAAEHLKNVDV